MSDNRKKENSCIPSQETTMDSMGPEFSCDRTRGLTIVLADGKPFTLPFSNHR